VREQGQLFATPLFLVLLVVEVTDVTFAVDSIPAVFGITRDPFYPYTHQTYLRFWDCGRCTFCWQACWTGWRILNTVLGRYWRLWGAKMWPSDGWHISVVGLASES